MPDRLGRHVIARSREGMALQMQYYPSTLPVNLTLLNSTTQFSYLTGMWYGNNVVFRPRSTNYLNIVAGDGHNTSFSQSGGQGPSHTAIWSVEATGEIKAVWRDEAGTGNLIELILAVHESGQDLVFVLDFDAFAARYLATDGVYHKGSLVLEPI
ncbi:hypothetical protein FRC04_009108 [Tulasnella sp. 424]|nr:hypothetical protein FRC04_009108 [Tulasnella sp. 424]